MDQVGVPDRDIQCWFEEPSEGDILGPNVSDTDASVQKSDHEMAEEQSGDKQASHVLEQTTHEGIEQKQQFLQDTNTVHPDPSPGLSQQKKWSRHD